MENFTMKEFLTIASFVVASAATAVTATAHEGHAHKVMGTVVSISAEQIEVSTADGKKEVIALAKETVFKKDKALAAAKDVMVGMRVVLSVVEKEGKKSVSEVMLAAMAMPAATPHKH
jgi:hypothetical protein